MSTYFNFLYQLIESPALLLRSSIEEGQQKDILSKTFLSILIFSICQFAGFFFIFFHTNNIQIFYYLVFLLFCVIYFYLTIFLESSITSYFLKSRNVTPIHFGSQQVYQIISLSYYPSLFMPALSIIAKGINLYIYIIFMIMGFFWMLYKRYQLIRIYQPYFSIPAIFIIFIPAVFQICMGIIFIVLSMFSISFIIYDELQFILKYF